jgi:hypothetical protein
MEEGTKSTWIVAALDCYERQLIRYANFRFAAAVASFRMILRDSPYKGTSSMDAVIDIMSQSTGTDSTGYRAEFLELERLDP